MRAYLFHLVSPSHGLARNLMAVSWFLCCCLGFVCLGVLVLSVPGLSF